jgi:hypothetical protein
VKQQQVIKISPHQTDQNYAKKHRQNKAYHKSARTRQQKFSYLAVQCFLRSWQQAIMNCSVAAEEIVQPEWISLCPFFFTICAR